MKHAQLKNSFIWEYIYSKTLRKGCRHVKVHHYRGKSEKKMLRLVHEIYWWVGRLLVKQEEAHEFFIGEYI